MQSVSITSKVVSSNHAHSEMYSIQYYVIQFVSDLRKVGGFLRVFCFTSTNTTDRHDIAEILLKVALNTITLLPYEKNYVLFYHRFKPTFKKKNVTIFVNRCFLYSSNT